MDVISGKMGLLDGRYIGLRTGFLVVLGFCKELIMTIIMQFQDVMVMACHHTEVRGSSFQP